MMADGTLHLTADGFDMAPASRRVRFRVGAAGDLAALMAETGATKALVVCSASGPARYRDLLTGLGPKLADIYAGAETHCPEHTAFAALTAFARSGADCVVSIGGGSTIGLGKFIQVKSGRPHFCLPTTYCGSEMTPIYGMKIGEEKRTWRDPAAIPRVVIYDPLLSASLPPLDTVTTAMNGLAHCVEALYPERPNPIASAYALMGIRGFARAMPVLAADPRNSAARAEALYASYLGGLVVDMVGIGLHHKLCHVIGGMTDVPHGVSNAIVLPHVLAFNAPSLPAEMKAMAAALDAGDPAGALFALAERAGAPTALKDFGVDEARLDAMAAATAAIKFFNPRPVHEADVRTILAGAFDGRRRH